MYVLVKFTPCLLITKGIQGRPTYYAIEADPVLWIYVPADIPSHIVLVALKSNLCLN